MDINSRYKPGILPPAQRGLVSQSAAAQKYSKDIVRKKEQERVKLQVEGTLQRGGATKARAKMDATRFSGAVQVRDVTLSSLRSIPILKRLIAAELEDVQRELAGANAHLDQLAEGRDKQKLLAKIEGLNLEASDLAASSDRMDASIPQHQQVLDTANQAIADVEARLDEVRNTPFRPAVPAQYPPPPPGGT